MLKDRIKAAPANPEQSKNPDSLPPTGENGKNTSRISGFFPALRQKAAEFFRHIFRGGAIKRVPVILQYEAAECGAASLCMILGYYGKYENLSNVRKACRVSRNGCSLSNIAEAAEQYGLETEAIRTPASLPGVQFPCIAFWRFSHFIVIEGMDDRYVYLADPASGRKRITRDEFEHNFSNIVLNLRPGKNFQKSGHRFIPISVYSDMLKGRVGIILFIAAVMLLVHLIGVFLPLLENIFLEYILPSMSNSQDYSFFFVFGAIIVIQAVNLYFQSRLLSRFSYLQASAQAGKLYRKLLSLKWDFFQKRSHANIESRLSGLNELTDYVSTQALPSFLSLWLSPVYLAMLCAYSMPLAIVAVLTIALIIGAMLLLIADMQHKSMKISNELALLYARLDQNIRLFDTLKAASKEAFSVHETVKAYYKYENAVQDTKLRISIMQIFPVIAPVLLEIAIAGAGTFGYYKNVLTIGQLAACESLAVLLFVPVQDFSMNLFRLKMQISTTRSLDDIQKEEEDPLSTREQAPCGKKLKGDIELKNISFGYVPGGTPDVSNISLEVHPGESIALVGSSGSGKSTILSLIQGLYEPWSGEILLDGTPLKDTNRAEAVQSISIAMQKPALYRGTVGENICLFRQDAKMSDIVSAAKAACIYDDIIRFPGGFNMQIDPLNMKLSSGQVQLLMLARALYKKPSVLILDEATANMDALLEEQVMRNIRSMGITMVIVAHRLSTIRDCTRIYVLDSGKIVEQGSHDELIGKPDGLYRKLTVIEARV